MPPERLGPYLREFTALMQSHHLDGLLYGHFGDGCVHIRIDLPLADHPDRMRPFLTEAAHLVASTAARCPASTATGGPERAAADHVLTAAIEAFGAFKALFDPDGLLNPGVIVGPGRWTRTCGWRPPARCGRPAGSRWPRTAGTCPRQPTGA